MNYIAIEKELIPYAFEIVLGEETFRFEINYNLDFDFFTLNLYKDDETLVLGEKIVYNSTLFEAVRNDKFPKVKILPTDLADQDERVTWENFNETVFLYVYNEVEE